MFFLSCYRRPLIKHYNFAITPDVIWTTILNGLAQHINKNAEKLRKKFVSTPGKIKLEVRRDNFLQGSVANDWMGVIYIYIFFFRYYRSYNKK